MPSYKVSYNFIKYFRFL